MKYIHFFIIWLFSFGLSLHCQTFNIRSDYNYTSAYISSILPTDSCYYATGVITDGTFDGGVLFLKLDLNGNPLISKSYFRENAELLCFFGTLQEYNNNLYLSGYATGVPNGRDGLVIQFNTEGDTIRTFQYQSTHEDPTVVTSTDMIVENENRFSFMNAVSNDEDGNHRYLCVTDSLGTILYDEVFRINDNGTYGNSLVRTENGYITGLNFSSGSIQNPIGSQRKWFKLDSEVNIINSDIFPNELVEGEYWQGEEHTIKTNDGNILAGSTRAYVIELPGGGEFPITTTSFLKYTTNFDTLWMKEMLYEDGESAYNRRITEAIDSSGYTGGGTTFLNGNWHGHIAKVSPEGDSLWYRIYNYIDWEDHNHEIWDIEPTPDGGYIFCGYNTTSLPNEPFQQGWIVKTDEYGCVVPDCHLVEDTVAVQNINLPQVKLKLYPNPVSDILNVFFRHPQGITTGQFRIVNEQGQTVRTWESDLREGTHVLSVADYVGGVYFLQYLEDGVVLRVERFVVL